eukprot:359848-Chlamydomonas_euryale.AAC.1
MPTPIPASLSPSFPASLSPSIPASLSPSFPHGLLDAPIWRLDALRLDLGRLHGRLHGLHGHVLH